MNRVPTTFYSGGDELLFCDMRPGFSQDGVKCVLPTGSYQVLIDAEDADGRRGFRLHLPGVDPDGASDVGTLLLDMARVGVFDRQAFLKAFDDDWESLFEWSDSEAIHRPGEAHALLRHEESGLTGLCVEIGADCECLVQILSSGSKTVGVRVAPRRSPEQSSVPRTEKCCTWVEIKCRGIGEPWAFCDDWDYEPEIDDALDEIVSEVSFGDAGDSLDFGDDEGVDPDAPISTYRRRFGGVAQIAVLLDRGGARRQRLKVPEPVASMKFGARTTSRELATALVRIFKAARE